MRKQFLGGKARNGLEFQMFQRNLKKSGATDPGAIATQLQSSLEKSATAHKKLSAMLDNAKRVRLETNTIILHACRASSDHTAGIVPNAGGNALLPKIHARLRACLTL